MSGPAAIHRFCAVIDALIDQLAGHAALRPDKSIPDFVAPLVTTRLAGCQVPLPRRIRHPGIVAVGHFRSTPTAFFPSDVLGISRLCHGSLSSVSAANHLEIAQCRLAQEAAGPPCPVPGVGANLHRQVIHLRQPLDLWPAAPRAQQISPRMPERGRGNSAYRAHRTLNRSQ